MPDTHTILVTGATGRLGRLVVDELRRGGVRVRALTRRPAQAKLPAGAEVVGGDLTVLSSLDAALAGVDAVFVVWTAPITTAADVVARIATESAGRPRRVVYLSAPFRTPHPFFQQPNPMRELHAEMERLVAAVTSNLATLGVPAFVTTDVHEILGTPARPFSQWTADHADAFTRESESSRAR